jgi:hypothetical protein
LHISFSQRIICRRNEFVAKKGKKRVKGGEKGVKGVKGGKRRGI